MPRPGNGSDQAACPGAHLGEPAALIVTVEEPQPVCGGRRFAAAVPGVYDNRMIALKEGILESR